MNKVQRPSAVFFSDERPSRKSLLSSASCITGGNQLLWTMSALMLSACGGGVSKSYTAIFTPHASISKDNYITVSQNYADASGNAGIAKTSDAFSIDTSYPMITDDKDTSRRAMFCSPLPFLRR